MTPRGAALTVGRVAGFRGRSGEVTVRVASGEASRWTHLKEVTLVGEGSGGEAAPRAVEAARAYRDRLVLKLAGIDDATAAERLAGLSVVVRGDEVPALPEGVYWVDRLIGARVEGADGAPLGRVEDVMESGGCDLLVVRSGSGGEVLVPLVRAIVPEIDAEGGRIRVDLPDGLLELNAPGGGGGTGEA